MNVMVGIMSVAHGDIGPARLQVSDLRTHIHSRRATIDAVDGVSFSIQQGETVGLVGESGCGKSMVAMSIMQLLPPGGSIVGGSIALDGRDLTKLRPDAMRKVRGNEIAMVFQDPMTSLNPTMKIGEQIAESYCAHRGASKKQGLERAAEVLNLVGMPRPEERLSAYPHQLSGGLRQRTMIALALACEPKILIADEPTTALDVTIQAQILRLLDDLKTRLNMGMLLITHDMGVIAEQADRVVVMYAGRIVESSDTATLFADMRHPYTEALLDSVPDLKTDRGRVLYSIPGTPPDLSQPPPGCRFAPRCRYAKEQCHQESPALGGEPAHRYACFFPVMTRTARSATLRVLARTEKPDSVESDGPLLVVDRIVKEFPITKGVLQRKVGSIKAVSDVSFTVARGETFGLVGESGCGKTTIGRLIAAYDHPDSGSIAFDQHEVSRLKGKSLRRNRRDVQLIFQDPYSSLDPRMRIRASLREPLTAQRIGTREEQEARIHELLSEVGLARRSVSLYPHEFSGGQRQRIGIARALTLGPRLIVADEPVSALDVSIQSQVLNLLRRLQGERDLTYIVISHDLSVVRYVADRVGIMYLGKLVEIGPTAEVFSRPAHPYTQGLLDAVPEADPVTARAKAAQVIAGEIPSAATPPSGCRFRTRCPRAQQLCADEEPQPRTFDLAGHQAACHFPLEAPVAVSAAG
jgi:peptide/nickel transport system ATP-binding protein